jgi:catechol 2,3-dioxygenase-like lactoylglutathione lyase family enzyme
MTSIRLQHIDHVAITVRDIPRSIEWYTKTLGLEHRSMWDGEPQMLVAGDTAIALFSVDGKGIALSDDEKAQRFTMQHFAFRVDRANFERAQEEFREQGIAARFADHGVCHSVYISDPDGHAIEITTYEI